MPPSALPPQRVTAIIWTVIISSYVFPLMFSMVGVILPPMGIELHASGISLGLVESLFLATSAALALPAGRFSDATDKSTVFTVGLALYTLTTVAIGVMPSIQWVLFMRFLQGLASSLYAASGMAILTEVLPPHRRGRVFGMVLGAVYAGLATGPLLAGTISDLWGWRWVFYLSSIPMATSFLAAWLFLERRWQPPRHSIDLKGSLMVFLGMMSLVMGSAMLGEHHVGYWLAAAGIGLITLFLVVEERAPHPLLGLSRIRGNPDLGTALIAQITLYFVAAGSLFLISLHLQLILGYAPPMAGLFLTVSPVLMAIIAPMSGRMIEHLGAQSISMAGILLVTGSVALAVFIDAGTGVAWILMVVIIQGVGFALFSSPNMTIIMNSVDAAEASLASALAAMTRTLGMVFGMMVITAAMSLTMGAGTVQMHKAEYSIAMTGSYLVYTLTCLLAALFGLRRLNAQRS